MSAHQKPPEYNSTDPPELIADQIWARLLSQAAGPAPALVESDKFILESQEKEAQCSQQQAQKAKENFTKILEAWDAEHDRDISSGKKKLNKNPVVAKVRANISQMHDWEEVFTSLKEAEDQYNNSSKIRKFFRKATSKSGRVEAFVDLVPGGDFTSVVCAGIKFILRACSAANRSRQEIVELVEMLPEQIESAQHYEELYKSEPMLQTATCQLYAKILFVMEGIISLWTKDRSYEFLRPLLKNDDYRPLNEELQELRKASENVERTIQLCDHKKTVQMANRVEGIHSSVEQLKCLFIEFLRDSMLKAKWNEDILRMHTQQSNTQIQSRQAYITSKKILETLETAFPSLFIPPADGEPHQVPLKKVLQAGFTMAALDQHRVTWVISEPKVSSWLKSKRSRAVLVHGNCAIQRISPLSFFSALLIESLQSVDSVTVLHYFCGLHPLIYSSDTISGSAAMINTLLHQLITQWKFGELTCLSQVDTQILNGPSLSLTPDFLFSVFRKLIRALPRKQPIFLIIDGINYYETRKFCQETKQMVKRLTKLVGTGPLFKFFVTSTTRILDVNEYFEDDEKLFVPPEPTPRAMGSPISQIKRRFTFRRR